MTPDAPTPETDAAAFYVDGFSYCVGVEVAKTLERQRDQLKKDLEICTSKITTRATIDHLKI